MSGILHPARKPNWHCGRIRCSRCWRTYMDSWKFTSHLVCFDSALCFSTDFIDDHTCLYSRSPFQNFQRSGFGQTTELETAVRDIIDFLTFFTSFAVHFYKEFRFLKSKGFEKLSRTFPWYRHPLLPSLPSSPISFPPFRRVSFASLHSHVFTEPFLFIASTIRKGATLRNIGHHRSKAK